MQKIINIEVPSSDSLRKLFEAFDDLGFAHRFTEELGEFDVNMGGEWFMFYVNRDVLKDEQEDQRWAADAEAVAEYYWRQ